MAYSKKSLCFISARGSADIAWTFVREGFCKAFPLYLRAPVQGIRSEHTYGFLSDEWFKNILNHANSFVGSDYGFEFLEFILGFVVRVNRR